MQSIDVQNFETDGSITPEKRAEFDKGHWDMLASLQKSIGDGPLIANHAYNLTGMFKIDQAALGDANEGYSCMWELDYFYAAGVGAAMIEFG
jgi:hypothetical protein